MSEGTERPIGERTRAALRAVRWEAWKAATIHAVVDGVAIFLVVNLVVTALGPPWLPDQVPVPTALTDPIVAAAGASISQVTLPSSALVGLAVGLVALCLELWLRLRHPLVEQFEAVNPPVAEALRTARDALEDEQESPMAVRLYEDVLDRLAESSSVALVNLRRLVVTLLLVAVVSVATVQVAAVDLALLDGQKGPQNGGNGDQPREFTGLEDGDAVLGDPEDVQAGDENLTAQIESTGGDEEVDPTQQFPSDGGGTSGGEFDSQQAGFAGPEELEDAELIREYNLRIRDDEESDT